MTLEHMAWQKSPGKLSTVDGTEISVFEMDIEPWGCGCAYAVGGAFRRTPSRFKHRMPQPQKLPTAAWINPPTKENKAA